MRFNSTGLIHAKDAIIVKLVEKMATLSSNIANYNLYTEWEVELMIKEKNNLQITIQVLKDFQISTS